MKKIFKFILFLIICYLLYKLFVFIFVNDFSNKYKIVSGKHSYDVLEKFNKNGDDHTYSFTIDSGKDKYSFSYNHIFHKKKHIIKNIKYYKNNNLKCIYPIYLDDNYSDIYCLYNNKQVSYSYLKQINNKDIDKVISLVKKDGYRTFSYSDKKSISINSNFISVYKDNILDDYIYTVWYYKGINIINNKDIKKIKFFKTDKYENDLSMLVGNYYVTFNQKLNNNHEYSSLILYNLINNKKSIMKLKKPLSINTYINGVYNDKLYVTDNDSRKQYRIDLVKKSIKKVGDRGLGYKKLVNSKLDVVRANKDNYFDYTVSNKSISKLYDVVSIYKNKSDYYFVDKKGYVYRVINNEYKNPVLLFKMVNMDELRIKNDNISFVSDNIIYNYNDVNGLKEIIVDNELRYNYKNIYDFMKK